MRVWLASYPRSGNTFLRVVLNDRYGLSSDADAPVSEDWVALWRIDAKRQPAAAAGTPRLVKTHELPGGDTDAAVYIVRDGRDALLSYAHFVLAFERAAADGAYDVSQVRAIIRDLILERQSPYGTWSTNVLSWTRRPNTVTVRFEELVVEPTRVVDRVVATLGLDLAVVSDVITTFEELKRVEPRFFRRGQRGEWRDVFDAELHRLFWEHNGPAMTHLGYSENVVSPA